MALLYVTGGTRLSAHSHKNTNTAQTHTLHHASAAWPSTLLDPHSSRQPLLVMPLSYATNTVHVVDCPNRAVPLQHTLHMFNTLLLLHSGRSMRHSNLN